MAATDFSFEFLSEVPDPRDVLRMEMHKRFGEPAEGHTDVVGASVAVEELMGPTTSHLCQVRVVTHVRPTDVVAVEKAETAGSALNLEGATEAVERRVRAQRAKLREQWKAP